MLLAVALSGLFTDHMVLQRGKANAVWGTDQPQQVVTLTVEGAPQSTAPVKVTVGADGTWRLLCPELPTGGPYRLRIKGSDERVLDDVLVGDVWLASGQSNMEFPLSRAKNADTEIAKANWPKIRFAKIQTRYSRVPEKDVVTSWTVCQPDSASGFTAVGYFFAREIHQKSGVPIGIIDSTWGGTRVEAWASREALQAVWPGVTAELDQVASNPAALEQIKRGYAEKVAAWEKASFPQDEVNAGEPKGWAREDFNDQEWKTMPLPGAMQAHGFHGNGVAWFRRTIELPADWKDRGLSLSLGPIDDFDTTYFNGEKVGATGVETPNYYQYPRRYDIPARLVRPGKNVIAVRVFDHFGDGGLMGPAGMMYLENPAATSMQRRIPLSGAWRWQAEKEIPLVPATVYQNQPPMPPELDGPNTATELFNGMIAPLIPYGLTGYIWYQGEANVGNASTYRDRFTALIRDWRTRWGQGTLPFYFVQLANFTESPGWPLLREAQAQTLAEPATAMAVIVDIGNPKDIHPTNKQDVGHRLALHARRNVYGEKSLLAASPCLDRVEIKGASARVYWKNGDALKTRDGAGRVLGFELAGADGVYHPAVAGIVGDTMIEVTSPEVPQPVNVRYAWADNPQVNLENRIGLPATPFRTDGF